MCKTYITDRRSIDPTGHTEKEIVTEPKCAVDGLRLVKCTVCSKELDREVLPALGHTWETGETEYQEVKAPTCTVAGTERSICTRCNKADSRPIDPLGHEDNWEWVVTLEPTCEKEGMECTHCIRCPEVMQTQSIDALGHHDDGEWVVVKKATCGEEGRKATHCINCKQEVEGVTQSEVIPKDENQHNWVNAGKSTPATCAAEGYQPMKCSFCGKQLTAEYEEDFQQTVIPKLTTHTWGDWIVTKAATIDSAGSKYHVCKVCGKDTSSTPTTIARLTSINISGQKYNTSASLNNTTLKKGQFIYSKASTAKYGVGYKVLSVTKSGTKVTGGNVMYMKNNDPNAKVITVPAVVKLGGVSFKVTAVGANAFKANKKITKVTIGKNVTLIGSNAFMNCTALTTVTFGSGLKEIGSNAFNGCAKLTKVTFGVNVTKIGAGAFKGCKALKTIIFNTKKLGTVGKNAFTNINTKAIISVPKAKLKLYTNKFKASSTYAKTVTIKGK